MAKLLAADRQNKIIELLQQNHSYKMAELAQLLDVSKETIRRDLIYLDSIGAVNKSHGGVTAPYELHTKAMSARIHADLGKKEALCRKALSFVPDQGVVYLDTGSTITQLAHLLRERKGLTIITNSFSAADALIGSENSVILTGGQLNSVNLSMEGYQVTNFLQSIKFETAFFGTNGFEGHNGPTTCDFLDVQSKKIAIANAKTNIVITESTKASVTSLMQYSSWHDIDHLITDADLDTAVQNKLKEVTDLVLVTDEEECPQ